MARKDVGGSSVAVLRTRTCMFAVSNQSMKHVSTELERIVASSREAPGASFDLILALNTSILSTPVLITVKNCMKRSFATDWLKHAISTRDV